VLTIHRSGSPLFVAPQAISWHSSPSDRIIGYAGVRRMLTHGRPVLNLAYRFVPEVWGQGFATEAVAAVLSRALEGDARGDDAARVRPANRSNRNAAVTAGLQRDTTMYGQGEGGLDRASKNPGLQ
jgi:[ribosomal protein S5]-alanine N-acetyltransferase